MAEIRTPAKFVETYAVCIDDTPPNFKPLRWIEKDRLYRVKYLTPSLNSDGLAVTIADASNREIHPSDTMRTFKEERFSFFTIVLN